MHALTPILSFLLPISAALQVPSLFAPFSEPYIDASQPAANQTLIATQPELLKRQLSNNNCPISYNACSQTNYLGACCLSGTICTQDAARHIACCPTGATCTGVINGGGVISTTGVVATTTNVFGAPLGTTTASIQTLTNPYFPFPIIATSYPNSAACNSAYQACQTNYAACTANLQGGGFGVTVVAPNGGGITLGPNAQNLGVASATSICGSLSQQACYGIMSGDCAQFGQGGSFVATATRNHAARQTGCIAAGAVAMGLGIAGQMV